MLLIDFVADNVRKTNSTDRINELKGGQIMGKKLRAMFWVTCFLFACMIPFGVTAKAKTVTITFDYGINQSKLERNDFVYGTGKNQKTFLTTMEVEENTAFDLNYKEVGVALPIEGEEVNRMNFAYWEDEEGNEYYYDDVFCRS